MGARKSLNIKALQFNDKVLQQGTEISGNLNSFKEC